MENRINKKVMIISGIVFLVIMYLLLIYDLNKRTAYKVDYNPEFACRRQEKDGFFYVAGAAKVNTPDIHVCVGTFEQDEELGEELEFSIHMRKNLFLKKKVYIEVYCSENMKIGGFIDFDENFNYVFPDPDNVDYVEEMEGILERHQDLIDELILEADKLWDIK